MATATEATYGRRAGLLRHYLALGCWRLGVFASLRALDWRSVRRLVFVCSGNICRSAYAEARARQSGLRAISCGLSARGGDPAYPDVVRRASARGVDLSSHRARRIERELLEPGDLLLALEPGQLRGLSGMAAPMTLLGLWASPPRPHIEDPYGLCEAYVDTCLDVIDSALANLSSLAGGARAR